MTDEVTPSTQGTEAPAATETPNDFREYVASRRATGELPPKDPTPAAPAAAEPEAPPAKTEPDSEPDEDQEQETAENANKPGSRRSRKIDKLTRENEELRRALSGLTSDAKPAQPPEPAKAEGKPKLEDFQTLEEYQESLAHWIYDEREKTKAAAETKRTREAAERAAFESWDKREKAAKKAHEDYEDVMETVKFDQTAPGVEDVRKALLESEDGVEILYYLAKHPVELNRIIALSPHSAVREIGKLEAALTKSSAPENGTPRITGAPKPPPPTGRPSKTSSDTSEEAAKRGDFRAYAKLRALERR